ncbi:cell division cycle and apoptosis regulator protein 1 [Leptinotarsa decemlineata]|uniref:cell division cycle and apoptosis regulator protein 1 n=1 Tax=Leptinotarsa decemlineata TaxID=7539 RepID=UPI000C2547AE|nr:cell division cycle and apoptosis regulator protein 1-like [Leptinotarsa decemlineata]
MKMNNNIGFNNKAWGRTNSSPNMMNQGSIQPQLMNQGPLGNMGTGMVQFPSNQQVFQNAMGLQQQNLGLGLQQMANNAMNAAASLNPQIANNPIFQQVSYPNTRGLNPTAFQTNLSLPNSQSNSGSGPKQRVFTGKVTQVHDNFGLVDEEVIFQTSVCVKGSHPIVGDRVLVEASHTPNMHFKWNATRIQVLTMSNSRHSKNYGNSSNNNYNSVPPPDVRGGGRKGGRVRERSRDRDRDDDESDRKRRREERMREREKEDKKSPVRKRTRSRSRSPKNRRRARIVPRYTVQVPKISLDLSEGDVLEVRRRYTNLYVPSDFFNTRIRWVDSFPPDKPFALTKPCSFHVMNKEIDPIIENTAVLEPPDADYLFSAKVMLMSVPGIDEIYQKCCTLAEVNEDKDFLHPNKLIMHPSRLINFLVGLRGKNETMAIGGAWSPSLDGENPDRDPSVLIKTAIRTCKALTGIDLSNCTRWYRFVELYYRRNESTHKGKSIPARVETVVLFLPDVWSCLPTRLEWDGLQQSYRKQLERILNASSENETNNDDSSIADEKEEEQSTDKLEPTHYSQLDPKNMVVNELRAELRARNISDKGLKSQLVARLTKTLKVEAEKTEENSKETKEDEGEGGGGVQEEKKAEVEEKKLDEREKALLEKRHTLPEQPHILVHPSRTAKSGKFECTVMSLSLLLDYRPEDTKEHSFEVSLFAELFNEMLIRDFGFNIYKALHELPEKKEEKKEKDEKKDKEDKKDDKKDKDEKKDEEEVKKKDEVAKGEEKKKDEEKPNEEKKKKDEEDKRNEDKKSDKDKRTGDKRDDDKRKSSNAKRDDKAVDDSDDDEESEEDDRKDKKRDKDRKRKEKVKLYTKDKHLLLSFVYFDQTHCGYIFDKDIEDLLFTLGLKLSRAQVKKLVSKVVVRDTLHYRKLTDKPKEEESVSVEEPEDTEALRQLALGNKSMLPVLKNEDESKISAQAELQEGFAHYRGSLVDIGKLISQLERSEKTRIETEARMVDLKHENQKLSDKYSKSNSTIKHLNSEVKDYRERLRNTEDSLHKVTAHSKLFQQTLVDIRDKIDPVLKSTAHKEDSKKEKEEKEKEKDRDNKKYDDGKSRWEKDKDNAKKEETADVEMSEVKKEKE